MSGFLSGTMSFHQNGESLGVAFRDIPRVDSRVTHSREAMVWSLSSTARRGGESRKHISFSFGNHFRLLFAQKLWVFLQKVHHHNVVSKWSRKTMNFFSHDDVILWSQMFVIRSSDSYNWVLISRPFFASQAYFPAVSLSHNESCWINFGQTQAMNDAVKLVFSWTAPVVQQLGLWMGVYKSRRFSFSKSSRGENSNPVFLWGRLS